jgi:hypothetical protein
MSGIKIANENTTNGVSGEPMSSSFSNIVLFPNSTFLSPPGSQEAR